MSTDENEQQQFQYGVERIRKIRGGHRSVVKKLGREASRLTKEAGETNVASRLNAIGGTLNEKKILLEQLNEQILARCEEAEIDKEIEEATEVSTGINEWIGMIKRFNEVQEAVQPTTQRTVQPTDNILNTSVSNESTQSRTLGGVRLPKINLPRFNGDITKYQHFIQSFKCSIEDNETLSCVNKLNYLINSLEGPAYKALEGLQIIEENYQKAMDTLDERYGKSQLIISAHMQELLSLQNERSTDLRAIYDKIMVHVRGLESMGISSEKYGSLLIPVILSRMPNEIALQVARKTSEDIWSIDEIMKIIRREIEAREVSSKISVNDKKLEKPAKNPFFNTTKTFVTKFNRRKPAIECYFCRQDHYSSACKEVTDTSARKSIIAAARRCFNCLRTGHNVKECKQAPKCYHCNGKHNAALCMKGSKTENVQKPSTSITTSSIKEKTEVLLQTAQTYAYGVDPNKQVPVNVLFDCGSQKTFVSEELQKKLDLKSDKFEQLNLNTFGSEQYVKKRCERIEINLVVGEAIVKLSALSSPALCSPVNSSVDISSYPHLQGISLANGVGAANSRIDILIGADHYYDIVIGDVIRGSGGPVAINSKLGWLLSGPVFSYNQNVSTCNNINLVLDILPSREEVFDQTKEIVSSVDRFWRHEAMGIESSESVKQVSQLDIRFKEKDERYEVCLPWKDNVEGKFESNYELCKNRLLSLFKKLKEKPLLLKQYDEVFKEQLDSGVIEKVSESVESDAKVHFLCHFGVVRQQRETTKLRVVFDGSAKANSESLSLNDRLEVGSNHMPLLFDTIIRFRLHPIAMIADIEKAFLQVQINETDRDMVRFLWFDDVRKDSPRVIEYRYCRLVFGLTCSPSILAETIKYHVSQFTQEDSKVLRVLDNLYCDDLSCGVNTREEAINLYKGCKEIMLKGGFNLRKWQCNDKVVQVEIERLEKLRGITNSQIQSSSKGTLGVPNNIEGANKVLGVIWDSDDDTLQINLCYVVEFAKSLPATKRSVLRIAAKIFDPMGYLTVLTINLKAFFQRLCINKVPWDETFSGEYLKVYESLLNLLSECPQVYIPRYVFSKEEQPSRIEVHSFSDASEKAFASVVYLRVEYPTGKVETKFVASKSRVAPLKKQSIPRLELLGACLMVKLVDNIVNVLQHEIGKHEIHKYYWVDSMTVLCWVKNSKPWVQYVRNRISEILSKSERNQWFYCPGLQNPADLPSRGKCSNLTENNLWWEGPEFLKHDPHSWPKIPSHGELETEEALKEKVRNEPVITHTLTSSVDSISNISKSLDMSRFSSKVKLLRTVGWVKRFIRNLKALVHNEELNKNEELSVVEINDAEILLIKSIQRESFCKEIDYLTRGKGAPPLYVSQFNSFLDEKQLLRCRTRIANACVSESSKTPLLIPSRNIYSELIMNDCHRKVLHNGARETLNLARQKYWVLRGREMARKIVKRCILCKRIEGLFCKSTYCPELPSIRVDDGPPFSNVGIDFAGPLYVKGRNAEVHKCYVCLFTCASTRAVHLELVETLDVEMFIRAFRRFCARRGLPSTIISDNAKTFKSASKEVKRLVRSPRLKREIVAKSVRWKFITALAPWQGGMWERLIRSTKRCLIKVIGRSLLSFVELNTLLVEVECIINSRPLTYIYDDQDGVSYPLTPSELINGRNLSLLPNDYHYEIVSTHESLSKRAKYNARVLNQFIVRWRKEYLTSLLEAYKPKDSLKESIINVGDIVILSDSSKKRIFWKFCKILEVYKGQDGAIRSAKIEVGSADSGKKILIRPVKLLVPLEVPFKSYISPQVDNSHMPQASAHKSKSAPQHRQAQSHAQGTARARRNTAVIGEILRRDKV